MADELLKKVRVNDGIYVEVYQQGKRKYTILNDSGVEERGEKSRDPQTDDYFINEALRLYAVKKGKPNGFYKVIQDPYKDPYEKRVYGNGDKSPYYLNNGCKINIQWIGTTPNPKFELGTFSNPEDADYLGAPVERYLYNQPITASEDDAENRNILQPMSSWVVAEPFQMGLDVMSNPKMTEPNYRDKSTVNDKIVTVSLPDGVKEEGDYLVWTDGGLMYNTKAIPATASFDEFRIIRGGLGIGGRPQDQITYFTDSYKDSDIIKRVIEKFISQVTSLHGISYTEQNLQLCSPDTASCSVIPYYSPVLPPNNTPSQIIENDTPKSATQSSNKIKLSIDGLPDDIVIKAKTNLDTFTIWAGPIPKSPSEVDNFEELADLDQEYMEGGYMGFEETGMDFKTWAIQSEVSNSQEDSNSNMGTVGGPVDIKPYSSFSQLLDLAGQCARALGKNSRVNAENLKKGYTKGIHGLCPQGTQAVLYALTGVKALGQISGNADWFSFKNPTNPAGGENRSSFSSTGYFNDKVKIKQNNGSWKGTYLTDKSQWQVGDVIAMGYTNGKNYGHIQVWTGFKWMSDFTQNAIQQNNVDPNSVALWRLNQKGIDAVNKQSGK